MSFGVSSSPLTPRSSTFALVLASSPSILLFVQNSLFIGLMQARSLIAADASSWGIFWMSLFIWMGDTSRSFQILNEVRFGLQMLILVFVVSRPSSTFFFAYVFSMILRQASMRSSSIFSFFSKDSKQDHQDLILSGFESSGRTRISKNLFKSQVAFNIYYQIKYTLLPIIFTNWFSELISKKRFFFWSSSITLLHNQQIQQLKAILLQKLYLFWLILQNLSLISCIYVQFPTQLEISYDPFEETI